jgi:glycosyltransferase involved in cell wall biosynthesis
MTTAVVIATYSEDRLPYLRRGVEGLSVQTQAPDETIIAVDSNPELSTLLRAEMPDWVTIVDSDGRGASAARNKGFDVATSEVVACLDDDARPAPGWIAAITAPFSDDRVVCVGGHLVPDYEEGAAELPPELLWLVGCTYRGHRDTAGPVTRPIGANMAFRRAAMLDVGGFNVDFGPNGEIRSNSNEEIVLSMALREKFGDDCIQYAPDATVHHAVRPFRTTWRYLVQRSRVEGTSKAGVRQLGGSRVMGDDSRYLWGVLVPAIGSYTLRGRVGAAARCFVSGAVTGAAYAGRRARLAISK